ncbi:hypothetical protein JOM56_000617 [Amanita muscaria]
MATSSTLLMKQGALPRPARSTSCGRRSATASLQQPVLLEQRRLYDMNLQMLHDELHRGRYLTPQDFQPRFCEIQRQGLTKTLTGCIKRRLCIRSQSLTSSSSTRHSEWDVNVWPCRSASVEKSTGKLIEKEDAVQLRQQQNGNGNGMTTRRSARANRLELDIRMMDATKLERRLKRAA